MSRPIDQVRAALAAHAKEASREPSQAVFDILSKRLGYRVPLRGADPVEYGPPGAQVHEVILTSEALHELFQNEDSTDLWEKGELFLFAQVAGYFRTIIETLDEVTPEQNNILVFGIRKFNGVPSVGILNVEPERSPAAVEVQAQHLARVCQRDCNSIIEQLYDARQAMRANPQAPLHVASRFNEAAGSLQRAAEAMAEVVEFAPMNQKAEKQPPMPPLPKPNAAANRTRTR